MPTPTTKIDDFKAALQYGGARPTLFDFSITGWGISNAPSVGLSDMALFCNVSAIPALTVTPIERVYFGRTVKIPGDMVFADLTTSFINPEDYGVRNAVEDWMNRINDHSENLSSHLNSSGDWQGTGLLTQYSKDGTSLMKYQFEGIWPQTIGEVALSYDTVSDIETFDVTWSYNYYTTSKGTTSTVIDNAAAI
tara:strand:- start:155 stop:736 length:582 start_codon:yes stop_codon:yes gene_type:complete